MPGPPPPSPSRPVTPVGLPAMIIGIVSIPALLLIGIGGLTGLVAIGLGIWDFRNGARGRPSHRGQAIAGIVCGVVAIAGAVFLIARPDS